MDSNTSDKGLSSIKARVDALRKGSAGEELDPVKAQEEQQKKFLVDATTPIEEGVITMARSEKETTNTDTCKIEEDADADSELDREFNSLHPEHTDTADDYEVEESQTSGMSKRTKMMIAGGVATFGLLAYGATSMISAVKGKKSDAPVSLSLQSSPKSAPLLAAQPRISSTQIPSVGPTAFSKISSSQKQQPAAVVAAPIAAPAAPPKTIAAPAAQDQRLSKLQSAQLRAVPQMVIQQPAQAPVVAPPPQVVPAAPVKVEEPKETKKHVVPSKKIAANKKRKIVAQKRIKHDDDYIPQRPRLAKTKSADDVLAILEHARNSQ